MAIPEITAKAQHIVVLMLENRSFDHLLGTLPGVDGILDKNGQVKSDLYNLSDPMDPKSKKYAPSIGAVFETPADQQSGEFGGPSHSFTSATQQLFGVTTVGQGDSETTPYSGGAPSTFPATNCGFVKSFISELRRDMGPAKFAAQQAAAAAGKGTDPVQEVMQVFTAEQLPAIHTLARTFCVCDRWFSELPGPTEPNRLFMHAATSAGLTYNPWSLDIVDTPTIYDRLAARGKTWAFYAYDLTDATNFRSLNNQPNGNYSFDKFFADAQSGMLPFLSFLCPRYANSRSGMANSQHAPADVRYGDKLIADVYQAVRNAPAWENTLMIVIYDEHGGYYDHVPPPAVEAPDAAVSPNSFMIDNAERLKQSYLTRPDYNFDFTRLGFRVPAILVSPWIEAGTIDSTPYRHTSILRFIADIAGTSPLTKRDATAQSFASVLARTAPRADCPTSVPAPALPQADPELAMAAPPTLMQKEAVQRNVVNLPGHPDTGRPVARTFATNAELARYVAQRRQCAEWWRSDSAQGAKFETYQDTSNRWRWRLRDKDGGIIAASADSYADRDGANHSVLRVRFLSQVLEDPAAVKGRHT